MYRHSEPVEKINVNDVLVRASVLLTNKSSNIFLSATLLEESKGSGNSSQRFLIHVLTIRAWVPGGSWLQGQREILFLDWDIGLLASSRDPNSAGSNLFWFGLQFVGFLQTFYSQAVIQRAFVDSPAVLETGLEEKDCSLWAYNSWSQQEGELDAFLCKAAQIFEVFSKIQNQN